MRWVATNKNNPHVIEGFDSFSYEWFPVGTFDTIEEADAALDILNTEEYERNGRYNPIGNRYVIREYGVDCLS